MRKRRRLRQSAREQGRGVASRKAPADSESLPSYRRNRTLTGSKPEVGTERSRSHHLRRLRRRVGLLLAGALVAVATIAFGLRQFSGSVEVAIRDSSQLAKPVDSELYEGIFNECYQRHPLERFRFLTNYDQMLADMRIDAPELMAVEPDGSAGVGVSRYQLTLRQPVGSWVSNEVKYYVDANGVTFTRNVFDEPKVAVVDNSGAEVSEGAAIASGRLLSFVGRVVALSSDRGIDVTSIEVPSLTMRTLYVSVGQVSSTIRMTIDRAVEPQVSDMQVALRHFSGRAAPKYVDVRVQGKAFYRE